MSNMDATRGEKHLIHHLIQIQDKRQTGQDQLNDPQTQLFGLQVGEARGKATEKKQQTTPNNNQIGQT